MLRSPQSHLKIFSAEARPKKAAIGGRSCLQVVTTSAAFASSPENTSSSPIYPTAPEPLLTVSEAARLLAVSDKTIRRWITAGRLPAVRLGRLVRISSKSLNEFIQLNEQKSDE
jgi:excisionase family DNA binding protein